MENRVFNRTWIQGESPKIDDLRSFSFQGEDSADTFVISGKSKNSNGSVAITGAITGLYMGENNMTVPLSGSVVNDNAVITFDEACYTIPGKFVISIFAKNGGERICIYCGVGYMFRTQSEKVVYPTEAIPDIQELIEETQAVIESIPPDYMELSNDVDFIKRGVIEIKSSDYEDTVVPFTISATNTVLKTATEGAYQSFQIPRNDVWHNLEVTANASQPAYVLFLKEQLASDLARNTDISDSISDVETGRRAIDAKGTGVFEIPDDCNYILIFKTSNSANLTPYIISTGTAANIALENAIKANKEQADHEFDELAKGLYEEQYGKTVITPVWQSGRIKPENGETASSDQYIRTGYIPVYNSLPIEISAPDNIKFIVVKYDNNKTVASFAGCDRDFATGKQRQYIDSPYFRICAGYVNGSTISTSAGANITLARYANHEGHNVDFSIAALDQLLEKNSVTPTWSQGNIRPTDASVITSDKHIRTGYIKIKAGNSFRIDYPEGMLITVLEYDMQAAAGFNEPLTVENALGYYVYNEESFAYIRVVASYMDESDILPEAGANITISLYNKKEELNILVIGNSFSQDSFAYLPPVLNEALPEYMINYGVAYTSSASIQDHVKFYNNDTKYTSYWEWDYKTGRWKLWTSSGSYDRGKTLADIMALRDWDIIYLQPATKVVDDEEHTAEWYIRNRIIYPARKLLGILKSLSEKPFTFLMGEWLATDSSGDHGVRVFEYLANALQQTANELGIDGVIPIGAAFQSARSNATLQALGSSELYGGNMLYSDNQHMQSGLPALLATYTIANYILRLVGMKRGVHDSSFIPTTENCKAIKAWNETPPRLTHGESVGVTTENINAAQEIASMAIRYPYEITDCTNIFVDEYADEKET